MPQPAPAETADLPSLFNDAVAGFSGVRLAFLDKQRGRAAADRLSPSYVLHGPRESIHLTYLVNADDADALRGLVAELKADDDDDAYAEFEVLAPEPGYRLHEDDAAHLESGATFESMTVAEIEAAFLSGEPEMRAEGSIEDALERGVKFCDADVTGELVPGVLDTPFAGSVLRNHKDRQAANVLAKVRDLYAHLADHREGKKEGLGFTACRLAKDAETGKPRRKKRNVESSGAFLFDFDGGQSTDEVLAKFESIGATFAAYSSYNHLRTPGVHKLRVVLPFAEPFNPDAYGDRENRAAAVWRSSLDAFAEKHGLDLDRNARDITRFMNSPRHPKGGTFFSRIHLGPLYQMDIVQPEARPVAKLAKARGVTLSYDSGGEAYVADGSGVEFFLSLIGDGEGQLGFHSPIYRVLCSYFAKEGGDADAGPILRTIRETIQTAERGPGREPHDIDRYMSDAYLRCEIDNARNFIKQEARNESDMPPLAVDDVGNLVFGKSSPFAHMMRYGASWFGEWHNGDDGSRWLENVCQAFRVVGVAADVSGGGAAMTLQFDTAHNGTQEVTFSRAALFDRHEVPKLLAEKWFEFEDATKMLAFLKFIILPIDTLRVERTGWHGGAYLHPGGITIRAHSDDGTGKKLRLGNGTTAGDWRGGTLAGWKDAVAIAFDGDARGREHFALGVMAGGAGIVAGFVGMKGFPILNLHGLTSRGKSTALKLAASTSAAAVEAGAYQSLRKTDNGMEGTLSARSGITLAFDEGKTTNAETLDNVVWMMAHGAGKTRATVTGEARAGREFCGFGMTANEVPLAQMMAAGKKSQPGGFHARVCDVDVSSVPELTGDEKDVFFARIDGIRQHYGHTWEPIVRHLQKLGIDHVSSDLDRLAKELAGPGANAFTARSARTLALVWHSGIVMQELGLIPACDVERVVRCSISPLTPCPAPRLTTTILGTTNRAQGNRDEGAEASAALRRGGR